MNKLDEVSKQVLSLYDLNKISSFNFKDIGKVMLTDKKAVNDTVSFVLVSEVGKTFFLKQKIDQITRPKNSPCLKHLQLTQQMAR